MKDMACLEKSSFQQRMKNKDDHKTCNCRDKATCPVANKCLTTNVMYKVTVQYEDKT